MGKATKGPNSASIEKYEDFVVVTGWDSFSLPGLLSSSCKIRHADHQINQIGTEQRIVRLERKFVQPCLVGSYDARSGSIF